MKSKVISYNSLKNISLSFKEDKKNIGLCLGCFDLLHIGHIKHFKSAKKFCDYLIVCVTPDKYVNKGPNRPVINQDDRALMISSLDFVSFVTINKYNSGINVIKDFKPKFFFKGSEYETQPDQINKNFKKELNTLNKYEGEMIFTYDDIRSSTLITKKIQNK